ncbi:hypothetical protein GCM10022251_54510 [Phytohabitans flavus]|uniref:Anaphase-promoting complex subunit 4-like WD40 domain-containing protein n=1 Tax=Phytohabitans flavus TaxID=1076124 RepID=A0A6F8XMC8_9ACTN|nr:hypothetical protein [Phytohabitans flavus]BCB74948.1 hypothetical protein Pflav_013580 [Phytohabitans flavus]
MALRSSTTSAQARSTRRWNADAVDVWDTTARRRRAHIVIPDYNMWAMQLSPDGRLLATGSSNGHLEVWNARTGHLVHKLPYGPGGSSISGARFSPDSNTLAAGGDGRTVRFWSMNDGRQVGPTLTGFAGTVADAAYTLDGKRLVVCAAEQVTIWDPTTGDMVAELLAIADDTNFYSVAVSPDGGRFAVTGKWGLAYVLPMPGP